MKLNKMLLGGVSVLAMGTIAAPAFAQDNSVETVVVTGIRASLRNAQQIKRNADVFVDSVTAEDIGALPDRSVTEALQRIPGVSINYFAGSNDPDHFSAEGSGVVIRGLSDVRSEFNGRDAFSANDGRALSFADVPPELLSGVDVFKSPSADMVEGGISGTVNLRTRLPFDSDGQLIAGSFDGDWGNREKKWSWGGSGLYSNRWSTSAGEFGLLASVSRSELFTRADGTQVAAWGEHVNTGQYGPDHLGQTVYIPSGGDARIQHFDHERIGFSAAGQWKSNDDTMEATVQFIRSDSKEKWNENSLDVAADVVAGGGSTPPPPTATPLKPLPGTTFQFDGSGLFEKGVITEEAGWRSGDPTVPLFGMQAQDITRGVEQEYITNDYSGHFKWTPAADWQVDFDAQHVTSTSDNLDVSTMVGTWVTADLDMHGNIPQLKFLPPTYGAQPDATAWFQDPGNYFWRSGMDHIEQSSGHENAFRADVDHEFNLGWLDALKFGARYSDRDQTVRYTTYNWGAVSEAWGGNGPIWLGQNSYSSYPAWDGNYTNPTNPEECCVGSVAPNARSAAKIGGASLVSVNPYTNFQGGAVQVPFQGLFLTENPASNYQQFSTQMLGFNQQWVAAGGSPGWRPLAQRSGVVSGTPFLPAEITPVQEKTWAGYMLLKFGSEGPISGNIGLRYVHTEDTSTGAVSIPSGNPPASLRSAIGGPAPTAFYCVLDPGAPPGSALPAACLLSPADQARVIQFCNPGNPTTPATIPPATYQNWSCLGGSSVSTASNTFNEWLPSFNAKLQLNDDSLIRFALSRSMTRPDMGFLRNYLTVTAGTANGNFAYTTQSGNPFLKPVAATNYDLSYEWYFAEAGSFTAALFYKELYGVLTSSFINRSITNNGQTLDIVVTGPANSKSTGKVKGFELAYQQFYDFLPDPFDGLGINANFTYIQSGGVAPVNLVNNTNNPNVAPGGGCTSQCVNANFAKLPLEQLSKYNVNLALIYEKGPISARAAWNWRSAFLLTARDVIYPFYPIFNENTGTLDGSVFYSIDDNIKVGVQGVNLLNEVTKTTQVINFQNDRAGRSWFTNDRRLSFVLRATY